MTPFQKELISVFSGTRDDLPEIENYRWFVVGYVPYQYADYYVSYTTKVVDKDPGNSWKPEWDAEEGHLLIETKKESVHVEGLYSGMVRGQPFHIGFDAKKRTGVLWMDTPTLPRQSCPDQF